MILFFVQYFAFIFFSLTFLLSSGRKCKKSCLPRITKKIIENVATFSTNQDELFKTPAEDLILATETTLVLFDFGVGAARKTTLARFQAAEK